MTKIKQKNRKKSLVSNKFQSSFAKLRFFKSFLIVAFALITLITFANIQTTQNLSASSRNVLGEDEQSEEQKQQEEQQREANKQAEEEQQEAAKQLEEQQEDESKVEEPSSSPRTSIKSNTEFISTNEDKIKVQQENNKQETEVETIDGQKIKTKVEDDGTTKIEIEKGTVKLKYSIVNGQVVLNVEDETGNEVEIEDNELQELENEVENELEDDDVSLTPTRDNKLALTQNQVAALTNFPVSINVETKELVITTPAGQKIVTVLPDQAVQNLLATGIINSIDAPPTNLTTHNQRGTISGIIEIEIRNNELVYKVKGRKIQRILGLFQVETPVTAFVSTDTGEAIATKKSILTNIIDFLSP